MIQKKQYVQKICNSSYGLFKNLRKNLPYLQNIFEDSEIFVFTIENDEHHKTLKKLDIKNYELVKDSL